MLTDLAVSVRVYSILAGYAIMALPLKHPFSAIVAGPSMAGKSQWVAKLLKYRDVMITPKPEKVILCYMEWQPLYDTLEDVEFHRGMIVIDTLDKTTPKLLILDDMMEQCDQSMCELFTKGVHHRSLSTIFLCQNLFYKTQHMRTMNLNTSYLVIFKNPRDKTQVDHLSRQMYPKGKSSFLVDAFKDATDRSYGYLFIDLKQETEELMRIRTGIFPDEPNYLYMPKCSSSSVQRYSLDRKDA